MAGVVGMRTGDEPSQALPRQLSQGESQAVKFVAKVLGARRNCIATSKSSPLGGAGTPSGVTERVAVPLGKVDCRAAARRKGELQPAPYLQI